MNENPQHWRSNLLVTISLSAEVCNLGGILDSTLPFNAHIKSITNSFIISRVDYCNAVLYGVPNNTLDRLQHVHNAAARVLTRIKPWQHITPTLKQLHWLPIRFHNTFKILLLTYKSLHSLAPWYLTDLLHVYHPLWNLCSADRRLLSIPCTRRQTFGSRAFSVAAPTLWNSLRAFTMHQLWTLLNSRLKRHLFLQGFA